MNTHDKIELPEPKYPGTKVNIPNAIPDLYTADQVIAAIEADRKRMEKQFRNQFFGATPETTIDLLRAGEDIISGLEAQADNAGLDMQEVRDWWRDAATAIEMYEQDRQRRGDPIGYFQDVGHYRYEQVSDEFKGHSDVFPLYRAPQPAEPVKVPSAPDGWKLVPVKPSIAMCIQGSNVTDQIINGHAAAQVYAAMLHTSPVLQADENMVECDCGDQYPVTSYGAGYIDATGMCENCAAAQDAAQPMMPITQTKITRLREQGYTDYPVAAVLSDGTRHCVVNPDGVVSWFGKEQ